GECGKSRICLDEPRPIEVVRLPVPHRQCGRLQGSVDLHRCETGVGLQHECGHGRHVWRRRGGAEEVVVRGVVLTLLHRGVVIESTAGEWETKEGSIDAIRADEVRLLAILRRCEPLAGRVEENWIAPR